MAPEEASIPSSQLVARQNSSLRALVGYMGAVAFSLMAAGLAWALHWVLDTASLVLLFLLAVVLTAARFGRGPASLAAALAVLLFNVMFVPPRFSFAVADEQFFFTFAVMLSVGLLVGQLTAGLRAQAEAAQAREQQVRSLYDISRELGGALTAQQVVEALARFARAELASEATLWVRGRSEALEVFGADPVNDEAQRAAALIGSSPSERQPVYDTDGRTCLLPLEATMAVRGAMALRRKDTLGAWMDDERQLLQTCAHLLAGALERIHYLEVAQASAVEIEGERLRNVLLAAVSHDLRTPLASLIGLTESLELTRPAPSAQQREIAGAVAASARRMGMLVDNLLEMARLQSGRVQLNLEWQPIEEVVGTAVAAVPGLAERPLRIVMPDNLPLVCFDAVLMERVLVNLLENAVKYTPDGTAIEIDAWTAEQWMHLAVRDEGPGVPADRAHEIFRMFERGRREGATPGVGLGLALCRVIVEAHGGSLRSVQRDGAGAVFEVRVPRGEPPKVPPETSDLEGGA